MPLRKTERPPVIQDKVGFANETNATVYVHDIYDGAGLPGVQRGVVKKLIEGVSIRVFTATREATIRRDGRGGGTCAGLSAPCRWRRTARQCSNPRQHPRRPATAGRRWPAPSTSCGVGIRQCPARRSPALVATKSRTPPPRSKPRGTATPQAVAEITPWARAGPRVQFRPRGPAGVGQALRWLSQRRATDPGEAAARFPSRKAEGKRHFDPSYLALMPYIRRPGPESDIHLQVPLEWHAWTSELIQMLEKGHHR